MGRKECPIADMGVYLSSFAVLMPQVLLDISQVNTTF